MLTRDQARYLERFSNGGDFENDDDFFDALTNLSTTEELYYLVQVLNWDDYKTADALKWILDHPKCDAGTAQQIYWMHDPRDAKEALLNNSVKKRHKRTRALIEEIEKRYLRREYKNGVVSFDPRKECHLLKSEQSEAVLMIPAELREPAVGAELGDFYDLYMCHL